MVGLDFRSDDYRFESGRQPKWVRLGNSRTRNFYMSKRKTPSIYRSRYRKEYGYTIKEISKLLGWSYGTVHKYLNDKELRKELLDKVAMEVVNNERHSS